MRGGGSATTVTGGGTGSTETMVGGLVDVTGPLEPLGPAGPLGPGLPAGATSARLIRGVLGWLHGQVGPPGPAEAKAEYAFDTERLRARSIRRLAVTARSLAASAALNDSVARA